MKILVLDRQTGTGGKDYLKRLLLVNCSNWEIFKSGKKFFHSTDIRFSVDGDSKKVLVKRKWCKLYTPTQIDVEKENLIGFK